MTRRVRRLRHWKQRFDPNARFKWRTSKKFLGETTVPGVMLTKEIQAKLGRNKLRNLWEAGMIELYDFKDVKNTLTGEREKDEDEMVIKVGKRKWIAANDDQEIVFGTKKAAAARYDEVDELQGRILDGELDAAVAAVDTLVAVANTEDEEDEDGKADEDETSEGDDETETDETKEEDDKNLLGKVADFLK